MKPSMLKKLHEEIGYLHFKGSTSTTSEKIQFGENLLKNDLVNRLTNKAVDDLICSSKDGYDLF